MIRKGRCHVPYGHGRDDFLLLLELSFGSSVTRSYVPFLPSSITHYQQFLIFGVFISSNKVGLVGLAYLEQEQRPKGRRGPPRLPAADDLYRVYLACPSTFHLNLNCCTTMAHSKVLLARRACTLDVRGCPIPLQHLQYRKRFGSAISPKGNRVANQACPT